MMRVMGDDTAKRLGPNFSFGGAGDSFEDKSAMFTKTSTCAMKNENISKPVIFYPESLERALIEADRVLSRYFQVYNHKRHTISVNNNRARTAQYLRNAVKLLSDCRFIMFAQYLTDMSCCTTGNKFRGLQDSMKLDEVWSKRMTKQIFDAIRRLQRDCPRLGLVKEMQFKPSDQIYQSIRPILLFEAKQQVISSSLRHPCTHGGEDSGRCATKAASSRLNMSWLELQDVTNGENSPRVRFKQQTKQYGFDCEIKDFEKNCKSPIDELSVRLVSAIGCVRRNIRKEAYNSMSRNERRLAMRADLIKSFQPCRLLDVLLRHIKRFLSRNDGRFLTPCSYGLRDILLATVSLNGAQHVRAFLKNVIAIFLGSDKEAFTARYEYYALWSSDMKMAKAKLLQRWRTFISSFKRGPTEFSRLAGDVRRSSNLVCQLLMKELASLTHESEGEVNEENIAKAMSKFSKYIAGSFLRYQKLILDFLANHFIKSVSESESSSHDIQMSVVIALNGMQTFQDACLGSVDMIFRRVAASPSCRNRMAVAATKHLASQVVQLESRLLFMSSLRITDFLSEELFLAMK